LAEPFHREFVGGLHSISDCGLRTGTLLCRAARSCDPIRTLTHVGRQHKQRLPAKNGRILILPDSLSPPERGEGWGEGI